jgi:hypothetical protein
MSVRKPPIVSPPLVDFWKTLQGLETRLADLAHNVTWSAANAGTQQTLIDLDADSQAQTGEKSGNKLHWNIVGDDKTCNICIENEGDYDPVAPFLPYLPQHPLCRCWWSIEVG